MERLPTVEASREMARLGERNRDMYILSDSLHPPPVSPEVCIPSHYSSLLDLEAKLLVWVRNGEDRGEG